MDLLRNLICQVFIIPRDTCTDVQVLGLLVLAAVPLFFARQALNNYFDAPASVSLFPVILRSVVRIRPLTAPDDLRPRASERRLGRW